MTPEEALQQYHLDKAEREKQQQQIQQQLQTEKAKREAYYADLKAKKHPTKTRKSHICSNCGETIPKNTVINHPQTILMPGSSQPDGNGHFETLYQCNTCSPLKEVGT